MVPAGGGELERESAVLGWWSDQSGVALAAGWTLIPSALALGGGWLVLRRAVP